MRFSTICLLLPLALAACGEGVETTDEFGTAATAGEALSPSQEQGVVRAVNDAGTDVATLRAAGVSSRAAANLMARRDGADGRFGTADDRPFANFAEIDAVSQVGDVTLLALVRYAEERGFVVEGEPGAGVFEGVTFNGAEAAATLAVANTAAYEVLTREAGLRSTAANRILAARPIASIEALAAVPYVGTTTLEALKAFAGRGPVGPDLNAAGVDVLQTCRYVGPAIAAAIVDYRTRYGNLESYEEIRSLSTYGYRVSVSDDTVAGLRACLPLAGERRRVATTVDRLLANPEAFVGSIVEMPSVVMTGYLSARQARSMRLFDFAHWGYADWNAAGVDVDDQVALVVDAGPEMYRRASTRYTLTSAADTRLNVVNLTGIVERVEGGVQVRVRARTAAGRDLLQVDQRWVSAERVAGLASLWSVENGVVVLTDGVHQNRIAGALLDVHPAVVWHTRQTGEAVDVSRHPECYDCSTNPYTDDGQGLFRGMVERWSAAGRP